MQKPIDVFVQSDLYQAGTDEDGQPFIAEVFKVVAEFADGSRFMHEKSFKGCQVEDWSDDECGDYGTYFRDIRPEASAAAEKLAARIRAKLEAGGNIDLMHWYETHPAYGSTAYLNEVSMMTDEERSR